jgi:phosphoglucosamine mutase
MAQKYFGTDGIRGQVGKGQITPEFCLRLSWAIGKVFANEGRRAHVLIGKDTRISGYMLESVLQSGFVSAWRRRQFVRPHSYTGDCLLNTSRQR